MTFIMSIGKESQILILLTYDGFPSVHVVKKKKKISYNTDLSQ